MQDGNVKETWSFWWPWTWRALGWFAKGIVLVGPVTGLLEALAYGMLLRQDCFKNGSEQTQTMWHVCGWILSSSLSVSLGLLKGNYECSSKLQVGKFHVVQAHGQLVKTQIPNKSALMIRVVCVHVYHVYIYIYLNRILPNMCLRELSELSFTRCLRLNPFAPPGKRSSCGRTGVALLRGSRCGSWEATIGQRGGWIW